MKLTASKTQLFSAVKSSCSTTTQKELKCADKATLTMPLAAALLNKHIVKVQQGADLNNLKRQDAEKVGTF